METRKENSKLEITDILSQVFEFLPPTEWLALALTSKQFSNLRHEKYLWEQYANRHLPLTKKTTDAAVDIQEKEEKEEKDDQLIVDPVLQKKCTAHSLYVEADITPRDDLREYRKSRVLAFLNPQKVYMPNHRQALKKALEKEGIAEPKVTVKKLGREELQLAENYLRGHGVKKDLRTAKNYYQKAFTLGASESLRMMADLILKKQLPGTELEAKDCYKKAFIAGDTESARKLSAIYLEEEKWQDNPKKIWWLQVAAQCGYKKSLAELEIASKSDNQLAHCALAIVNSFVVPGRAKPSLFAPLRYVTKTSSHLLEKIIKMDAKIVSAYAEVGSKEGLLERHIESLLKNWVKDLKEKEVKMEAEKATHTASPS